VNSLRSQLDALLSIDPSAPCIEFERHWFTWGALGGAMRELDGLLKEAGLGQDARIGVVLRNRPGLAIAMLEVLASERSLVTLNALYPDDKLAADLASMQAPAIVAASQEWARAGFEDAVRAQGTLGIEANEDATGRCGFSLRVAADPSRWTRPSAPGVALDMLTSGTTGTPKRIPLTRPKFEAAVADWSMYEKGRANAAPRLRGGVQLIHASLAHIGGLGGMINAILSGRRICLLERFRVESFHDAVLRHRPSAANGPPTVLRMLLDAGIPREDLSSLKAFRVGTAPLEPALADAFHERYGIPILQNYGATEFAGGVAGWTIEDFKNHYPAKRGSVGRLNPGIRGRTTHPDTGEVLPFGDKGILELSSPTLGDPGAWMRTTDLAVVDEDNFLFLHGRSDNVIIRGGFKVSPDDVVRVLQQHPAVQEAAVIGVADARVGHVPVAALVLRPGAAQPAAAELESHARGLLLPYQVPAQIRFIPEMPRTASMKVDGAALRSLFATA
jgi:long-chain acyl-CoA synthetase